MYNVDLRSQNCMEYNILFNFYFLNYFYREFPTHQKPGTHSPPERSHFPNRISLVYTSTIAGFLATLPRSRPVIPRRAGWTQLSWGTSHSSRWNSWMWLIQNPGNPPQPYPEAERVYTVWRVTGPSFFQRGPGQWGNVEFAHIPPADFAMDLTPKPQVPKPSCLSCPFTVKSVEFGCVAMVSSCSFWQCVAGCAGEFHI